MKKRPFRVRVSCLLLAVGFTLGLSACGPKQSAGPSESNGPTGGGAVKDTVVIAAGREAPTFDTMNQNWMMTCVSTLLTHNCLVRVGDDLQPEPDLAESYEAVSDTEWVFHLRQGVKFHDGSDMDAEDVKATLEKAATVAQAKQYVEKIASVEVVDPYTVKITTNGPCSSLLMDLTNQQVSILSKDDIDAGVDFNTHVNGTGPYKFVGYTPGDKIEYEVNENYFNPDEKPAIAHMIWRIIPEGSARTIALESGAVDYLYDLETVDVPKLEANSNVEVLRQDSAGLVYVMINNEKPPFDNVMFRRAISAAIDRESIIKVTMNGFANPAISNAPAGYTCSTNDNAVGYDLDKAKEYLAQSGVDPSTVEMPLVYTSDADLRTATIIQANLAELGIKVTLESMDNATWLSSYASGDYTAGIIQLAQRTMEQWVTTLYHSKNIGATNGTRLNDPEIDALLDQAAVTLDDAQRQALMTQCVARLNELCPTIPLYSAIYVKAYNSGLGGANCNATGAAYYHWLFWK